MKELVKPFDDSLYQEKMVEALCGENGCDCEGTTWLNVNSKQNSQINEEFDEDILF